MDSKSDFFFGQYYCEGGASIPLNSIIDVAGRVDPVFFTRQLNRFLGEHDGQVRISDITTSPKFWDFIDRIQPSSVGYIEIYARTDINDTVEATLACDIVLDNGVLSVTPHWCAYKDIRTGEIVSTLLVPLYLNGLHGRTYLRWEDGQIDNLSRAMQWGHGEVLKKVFKLSKYPSAGVEYLDDEPNRVSRYIRELKIADEVAKEGLRGEEALKSFWERIRNQSYDD